MNMNLETFKIEESQVTKLVTIEAVLTEALKLTHRINKDMGNTGKSLFPKADYTEEEMLAISQLYKELNFVAASYEDGKGSKEKTFTLMKKRMNILNEIELPTILPLVGLEYRELKRKLALINMML